MGDAMRGLIANLAGFTSVSGFGVLLSALMLGADDIALIVAFGVVCFGLLAVFLTPDSIKKW